MYVLDKDCGCMYESLGVLEREVCNASEIMCRVE